MRFLFRLLLGVNYIFFPKFYNDNKCIHEKYGRVMPPMIIHFQPGYGFGFGWDTRKYKEITGED